ncbi:DUF6843 domain-containing protein [Paenibacillus flagellatus]|uniref:DUF6843 domain-containing protein n=1 Tax=Paenibacillus flagellatus TaxID=2211139 RepID=A0A2V5KUQ1_9BACL|nr:hypothetical protein [Paenibacillus flagellatus]PYI53146.1 hypothetical protein DLM86_19345 [Paenibacillus flagellatus]
MKTAYKRYLILFVLVTAAAVAIGTIGIAKQKSHIYFIPDGYTGWVEIRYDQKDSPALAVEGKSYVHVVPETGIVTTSNAPTAGKMEFYYIDKQGYRNEIGLDLIHGQAMKSKETPLSDGTMQKESVNRFFVGTEQQFHEATKK